MIYYIQYNTNEHIQCSSSTSMRLLVDLVSNLPGGQRQHLSPVYLEFMQNQIDPDMFAVANS